MKKKGILGMALMGLASVGVVVFSFKSSQGAIRTRDEKVNKFKSYYNILNEWLTFKQNGKSLENYFLENGYKTVAIYGMGELGNRLYDELKNTNIEVKYAVDKNAESAYSELEVLKLEDELPETDVMIVTATFAFDDIVKDIGDRVTCPIVSLEDVVYGA